MTAQEMHVIHRIIDNFSGIIKRKLRQMYLQGLLLQGMGRGNMNAAMLIWYE